MPRFGFNLISTGGTVELLAGSCKLETVGRHYRSSWSAVVIMWLGRAYQASGYAVESRHREL